MSVSPFDLKCMTYPTNLELNIRECCANEANIDKTKFNFIKTTHTQTRDISNISGHRFTLHQ